MPQDAEIAVVRGIAVVAARIARPVVSMFIAVSGVTAGVPVPAIHGARSGRHIRVPAFARFEATLSRLEKTSALTVA
jgi:hypothetical protein